ncbi:GNAT family N-acetyltransferase [Dysgonomonas sp. ZJ279]|uniref:GNAT family N-acetyltransferase n=1 Tax=Dysgonomonas sp. ZJ279 TaxID=2709796 RepID=UPI0013E9D891|nr:GNAT family N-acetyltransferase [Dysgonomonas sp. ZJ279]
MEKISIRSIQEKDNKALADLIRSVFEEFGSEKQGTVYSDPTTDNLFEYFRKEKALCWIAESDGIILGSCGIYPTDGLPFGCAELVKFYLSPDSRGKGIGQQLLHKAIGSARELNYTQLYLESFPEFGKAVSMYERLGFNHIDHSLGNSGHYACTIFMLKDL